MNVVEVNELVKSYGKKFTLSIDFKLKEGEFLGLVGENGAGKTTLLRIISGLLKPTSGNTMVFGTPSKKIKKISNYIGVINQYTGLPDLLKVGEFLKNECVIRDIDYQSIQSELDILGLSKYIDKKICDLSEGNKRKIVILKALLHKPKLIIMDEPTVGIDPMARSEIWSYVKGLKENGISAIICTHYLYEIEQVCDRVIFLDNGNVQKQGKIEELIREDEQKQVLTVVVENGIAEEIQQPLKELFQKNASYCKEISFYPDSFLITVSEKANDVLPKIVKLMYDNGYALDSIAVGKDSLEKVMAELYKEKKSL